MARSVSRVRFGGSISVASVLALVACTSQPAPTQHGEDTGSASSALWTNGDFESGAAGAAPPGWTVNTYLNPGITLQSPQTLGGLNLAPGGHALTMTVVGTSQPDPELGLLATLRYSRFGTHAVIVNSHSSTDYGSPNNGKNVNEMSQTMTIADGDRDPGDGKVHIRFAVAPVLQNPNHTAEQQPYYFIQLTNLTRGNDIVYRDFNLSAQAGVPWKVIGNGNNEIDYVDWSLVDIAPGNAKLAVGDQVTLQIIAAGCSLGGHFGAVYVDGVGATLNGLYVSGTGPSHANAGTDITYDLTYKNGSASDELTTEIDFTTPPDTTFVSFTPPVGAVCTTPAVGTAGTIVCTFVSVAAGASGNFDITVNIDAAATGVVTAGTYDIKSLTESPLIGNKITTAIGCGVDADCSATEWCHVAAPNACLAKVANGVAVPSDPAHAAPPLDGTCTAAAGTAVRISSVCDTSDNACGYANGDGTCNAGSAGTVCRSAACDADGKCGYSNGSGPCSNANAGTVCRSAVCDPDLKCGYAVGDGPCTAANASAVCRTGACSSNGTCEPAGGCNVDADCAGGNWCNESAHACTPKLPNGTTIPTDGTHTSPALNGTCTPAAAALVCQAGACDVNDNKCGYANGDGPCTAADGATVCRSGMCSANGTCAPAGGCNVDSDCSHGNWCSESTHTCTATLSNGDPMPTDAPHTSPTLDGTCSASASALVCTSAVCDGADNKCGYANGDGTCDNTTGLTVCRSAVCYSDSKCGYADGSGPCTAATGATVCRSGSCSVNGTCQATAGCNVDGDCSNGDWCNESQHKCTARIANGGALPTDASHTAPTLDGKCSAAAATLVCVSGVCDTDDRCGLANSNGPCTAGDGGNGASVCRSGTCDTDQKCGFENDHGPCTDLNGPTVCRSMICAVSGDKAGLCESCGRNSDCPAGDVCGADGACHVPDAGAPDSGVTPPVKTPDNDVVVTPDGVALEGGGLSCNVGSIPGRSSAPTGVFAAFSILGVLAARRRRSRARA